MACFGAFLPVFLWILMFLNVSHQFSSLAPYIKKASKYWLFSCFGNILVTLLLIFSVFLNDGHHFIVCVLQQMGIRFQGLID